MGFNLDDYEPVASRLDRWISSCLLRGTQPKVVTDLVHYLSDKCVFSASLYENDVLIATGWAEEVRGEGHINKTSHLENCETGAVGRALANAGLSGSDFTKRPSREEMGKVQRMTESGNGTITEPSNLASDKQLNMIRAVCKSMGRTVPSGIQVWTKREASQFIDTLKSGEQPAPQYDTPEEPF